MVVVDGLTRLCVLHFKKLGILDRQIDRYARVVVERGEFDRGCFPCNEIPVHQRWRGGMPGKWGTDSAISQHQTCVFQNGISGADGSFALLHGAFCLDDIHF